jgi:flagellar basal-body rod protein FlgB
MFDNIFGIHEQALLLHGEGYKARDIDFREVLAGSDAGGEAPLALAATDPGHIAAAVGGAAGTLKYRNPYQASLDGNTVETPVEQAAFAENNVRYQASLTFINSQISELQFVLSGQ